MPIIDVKVAGQLSRDQKERLSKEMTQLMKEICEKPESATYVTFTEIPRDNWAKSGQLLA